MKPFLSALLVCAAACAQSVSDTVAQGEKIFNQTCATGYCHGAKGAPGGAPRLVARGFDQTYIRTTITRGLPGTAMPAFGSTLGRADLTAVIAYVAALNGIAEAARTGKTPQALSPDAARGRDLFFDATRSFGRCSTCHEVNGIGIPVATPMTAIPPNVAALRRLAAPDVKTAVVDGDAMPALPVSLGKRRVILYDLTSSPPVQRSLDPANVKFTGAGNWNHAAATSSYNDAELASILRYLKEAVR